jgi:glucose/arabinose dehydrogenase
MNNIRITAKLLVGIFLLLSITSKAQDAPDRGPDVPAKAQGAAGQDAPWKAPASADALKNPLKPTAAIVTEGAKLYGVYCVSCHDKNGFGRGGAARAFPVKPASFYDQNVMSQKDGALFWKLSEGHGNMPGFKASLSEEKRWQLVTYIRQFSAHSSTASKTAAKLSPSAFTVSSKSASSYFPVPKKILNVSASEEQFFMVDTVITGLVRPWSMAFLPDNTMLITERRGNLMRVKDGKVIGPVGGNVPKGLRDVKLHPQYAKNHLIYLSYYIEPVKTPKAEGGWTVLMRGRLEGNNLVDEKVIYKTGPFQEGGETYGSRIAFDKAGFLYFTVGQRTIDSRHRWFTPQDKTNTSGKVLRLNDDGTIPADNPFVQTYGVLPEIFTYGHRQPQGLIMHPVTGEIWESEHGEFGGSEVNRLRPGRNYGWPEVTFSLNYDGTMISKDTARADVEPPMQHYTPSIAPSDFAFFYGDTYPQWNGNLFIGAMVQQRLVRTVFKNNKAVHDEYMLDGIGRLRDVKVGPDKLLYLMEEDDGRIFRLIPLNKNQIANKK